MDILAKLEKDVLDITQTLNTHIEDGLIRDTEIAMKVERLTTQVGELNTSITGLLNVWEQARGVLTFTRWLLWVSGSVVAILAYFKGGRG